MTQLLSACGGFLVAVLWFDLIFDVQALRHRHGDLPEEILSSIAGYYRRVTGSPMSRLVGLVMLLAIGSCLYHLLNTSIALPIAAATIACIVGPVTLAVVRVLPNAVRLGQRTDSVARQSQLARSIGRDHLFCLAAILLFCALQLP